MAAVQVAGRSGSYNYGISLETIRRVAAAGKLSLVRTDYEGARLLQSNVRVDGLYVYLSGPSTEVRDTWCI